MNTDYIKTFLAVYRAGSFVDVAKDQNLAPSSVSRSIATLETLLKPKKRS
jgi:DNA-binding transcriptional LysR family regulator